MGIWAGVEEGGKADALYCECASIVIVRLVYRKGTSEMTLVRETNPNGWVALGSLGHGFPRFHRKSDPSSIVQSTVIHANADLREKIRESF